MQTQNQVENKAENAKYETLGEPATILVGKQGFIEVAHKRATFKDGSTRDFVLIARGYVDRAGRKRTERLVTIPAEHAASVARVLAPGGVELGFDADAPAGASSAELRTLADVARELEA